MDSKQTITRSGRRSRAVATAAVAAVALASLAMSGVAGGADDDGDASSVISVSFEAQPSQGEGCASRDDALSFKKVTTPDTYSFVVTVSTDLCNPIDAKAAAYAMPDSRWWPWPQTLIETEAVPLGDAGVTTVTFAKDCDPIQFDLLVGATPEKIDPAGPHHGDLVFPHKDPNGISGSAYQYWPSRSDCVESTSSTTTPESTSSTTSTSEVPVTVEPATSLPTEGGNPGSGSPGAAVGAGGAPAATVGGIQASQSPASLSVAG